MSLQVVRMASQRAACRLSHARDNGIGNSDNDLHNRLRLLTYDQIVDRDARPDSVLQIHGPAVGTDGKLSVCAGGAS